MFLPTRRTRSKRTEHTCRTYYALTLLHAQPGGCRCAVVAAISVNTTEGWISIVGTIHINDFTFQTLAALQLAQPTSILLLLATFYYGHDDGRDLYVEPSAHAVDGGALTALRRM